MMTYSENSAFIQDLQAVIKKHGLNIMYSNHPETLVKETKGLEGYHMFFTKGEKSIHLRGGEDFKFASTLTIKLAKTKTEDDGC